MKVLLSAEMAFEVLCSFLGPVAGLMNTSRGHWMYCGLYPRNITH